MSDTDKMVTQLQDAGESLLASVAGLVKSGSELTSSQIDALTKSLDLLGDGINQLAQLTQSTADKVSSKLNS